MLVGFAGMTHLGFCSALAATARQIDVVCYDPKPFPAAGLVESEPGMADHLRMAPKYMRKADAAEALRPCHIVFVGRDVDTTDDLPALQQLIEEIAEVLPCDIPIVILSQVPPGFSRVWALRRHNIYYQVDTLITKKAMACAMNPARVIIGCADTLQELPECYQAFLRKAYPHLPPAKIAVMSYESAEFAKIAVNVQLAASIAASNTLAAVAARVGAKWNDVEKALRLEPRIGETAYVRPGRIGGHLPRDVRRAQATMNSSLLRAIEDDFE